VSVWMALMLLMLMMMSFEVKKIWFYVKISMSYVVDIHKDSFDNSYS